MKRHLLICGERGVGKSTLIEFMEMLEHMIEFLLPLYIEEGKLGLTIAIGCPHAPWPWVLSLCNSLLCGHAEQALRELTIMPMDNGIACESVDADTGECTTGSAFATCAGFLCHALLTACRLHRTIRQETSA